MPSDFHEQSMEVFDSLAQGRAESHKSTGYIIADSILDRKPYWIAAYMYTIYTILHSERSKVFRALSTLSAIWLIKECDKYYYRRNWLILLHKIVFAYNIY